MPGNGDGIVPTLNSSCESEPDFPGNDNRDASIPNGFKPWAAVYTGSQTPPYLTALLSNRCHPARAAMLGLDLPLDDVLHEAGQMTF
jgi:hypothetical protein